MYITGKFIFNVSFTAYAKQTAQHIIYGYKYTLFTCFIYRFCITEEPGCIHLNSNTFIAISIPTTKIIMATGTECADT